MPAQKRKYFNEPHLVTPPGEDRNAWCEFLNDFYVSFATENECDQAGQSTAAGRTVAPATPMSEATEDDLELDPDYNIWEDVDQLEEDDELPDFSGRVTQSELDNLNQDHVGVPIAEVSQTPRHEEEYDDTSQDEADVVTEAINWEDDDYKSFLNSLFADDLDAKGATNVETRDSDANTKEIDDDEIENEDPTYDFMDDIGRRSDDEDDELHVSLGELQDLSVDDADSATGLQRPPTIQLTVEQSEILRQQMRMHVQLLAQSYVLAIPGGDDLADIRLTSQRMLIELSALTIGMNCTEFKPVNLEPALKLTKECKRMKAIPDPSPKSLKRSRRNPVVPPLLRPIFLKYPQVFLYDRLLPKVSFDLIAHIENSKGEFTRAEDGLIAIGLEKMTKTTKCIYRIIHQQYLPVRSEKQIAQRVKNIRRNMKSDQENRDHRDDESLSPIEFYFRHDKLPLMSHFIETFEADRTKYSDLSALPPWLRRTIQFHSDDKCAAMDDNAEDGDDDENLTSDSIAYNSTSPCKTAANILKKYVYGARRGLLGAKPSLRSPLRCTSPDKRRCSIGSDSRFMRTKTKSGTNQLGELKRSLQEKSKKDMHEKETDVKSDKMQSPAKENQSNYSAEVELSSAATFNGEPSNPKPADDESHLAALMAASSTIISVRKSGHQPSKMEIQEKHKLATELLEKFDFRLPDPHKQEKDAVLIEHFLGDCKKVLTNDKFTEFIDLLASLDDNGDTTLNVKEVYQKMLSFLVETNASDDMRDRLVLLLDQNQANECGVSFEWTYWQAIFEFVRKLEVYSETDPKCLSKLIKSLTTLKHHGATDKKRLKSAICKAVNHHPILLSEISKIFLDDPLDASQFSSPLDFEVVSFTPSESNLNFEVVDIPVPKQDANIAECRCECHGGEKPSENMLHCDSCRICFVGNKMLMREGNRLFPARVRMVHNGEQTEESSSQVTAEQRTEVENRMRDEDQWTFEQDKKLLVMAQSMARSGPISSLNDRAFKLVAEHIGGNKSLEAIKQRFKELISMLRNKSD